MPWMGVNAVRHTDWVFEINVTGLTGVKPSAKLNIKPYEVYTYTVSAYV